MELLRVKLREEVEGPYKEVQINVHVQRTPLTYKKQHLTVT